MALATRTVSFVTTHGTSMLPTFHTGDLAVLVASSHYQVGQIVGYHSPLLHTTVLHRIIADHDGRFSFKGDHNDFVDPQRLPPTAVIGRLWFHIPKIGAWLTWSKSPWHAMAIALVALVLVGAMSAGFTARRRNRSRRRRRGARHSPSSMPSTVRAGTAPVIASMVLAAVFGLFYALSLTRPLERPSTQEVAYSQSFRFGYTSPAITSATYPDNEVQTGSPVFLKLVRFLHLSARYAITSARVPETGGTVSLGVDLVGPTGWTRQIASVGPDPFSGPSAVVRTTIDLYAARSYLADVTSETGVSQGGATIEVTPVVHVRGALGGMPLRTSYSSTLSMPFDEDELTLQQSGQAGSPGVTSTLQPRQGGSVSQMMLVANRMSVLGRSMDVGTARDVGAAGVALFVLCAIASLAWTWRCGQMDEDRLIRTRYGHQLITIAASPLDTASSVIDVTAMPALARLADRYDTFILDHDDGHSHCYFVECGASVYRYRARGSAYPYFTGEPTQRGPFPVADAGGGPA